MKIEIKGVEFNNKGAELMLHSIIAVLDKKFDNYQLVLSPGSLLPYPQRAKLGSWQKFNFQFLGLNWSWLGNMAPSGIRRLLKHFGIIVEKEIDLVLDASGFAYGDQWGDFRLTQTLRQLKRCAKYNNQYVFLSQAFGPFENQKHSKLMAKMIDQAALVVARDARSLACLQAINNADNIKCFPDFTPLLEVQAIALPECLPQEFACIVPNSKMINSQSGQLKHHYLNFLVKSIETIAAMNITPVLLNHEGIKDHKLCQEIISASRVTPLYLNDLGALEIKRILGASVLCISSRFHGCVSSLSQGVPTLATSWSHKYEELYADYQCQDYLLDVTEVIDARFDLTARLGQIIAQRPAISARLIERAEQHKKKANDMWAQVFEVITH